MAWWPCNLRKAWATAIALGANLPNPKQYGDHAYVPRNMRAIGDLFDLFDFDSHR
jgi:hypothetical protein